MVPSLETGVKRRLESPREGEEVRLIVTMSAVTDERLGLVGDVATIELELPLDKVAVTTTEERLEDICQFDFVTAVELDTESQVFTPDF